jgi:tetratricopeptide (TPR) repeat protein
MPVCMAREDVWTEVQSPNFTVISNGSPKQARRTAKCFEQFRLLLQTYLKRKIDAVYPLIVFATRDGDSFKALLPASFAAKNARQVSGIFMGNPERNFVALRLDVPEDQAYHAIYHEYVHSVIRLIFQKLPLWVNEGLAEFFSFAELSEGKSLLGQPSPEAIQQLNQYSTIPLSVLMSVTHDSPYYTQTDKARMFYAQSWALTHYLAVGDKSAHAAQLNLYLNLLQTDISEQEAAERSLGDLKTLEQILSRYTLQLAFYRYEIPTKLEVKEEEYTVRTLSNAASLALRGQCLVAANRLEDAKAMLEQALQLDPRSAEANEGMGLVSLRLGNNQQAQKYFSTSAELDSKSYLAQFYAARSTYDQGESFDTAERYLRKAIEINPSFVPAYNLLAHVLLMQKAKLPEALDMAVKAVKLEPAEMRHRLNVCQILIAMEKYDDASRIAESIAKFASNPSDSISAQAIITQIRLRRENALELKRYEESRQRRAKEMEERRKQAGVTQDQRPLQISPPAPAKAPAVPIKRGPARKVTGVIKSVQCSHPAIMDVVLDTSGKRQTLRAENWYNVQYEAIGSQPKKDLDPCKDLEGQTVEIEFQSVIGQEFSGFIRKCGIIK